MSYDSGKYDRNRDGFIEYIQLRRYEGSLPSTGAPYELAIDPSDGYVKVFDPISNTWKPITSQFSEGYSGFDNNGGGVWSYYINIPITTTPSEYAHYKVVIDPTNVTVYAADGTQKTQGAVASGFWDNVKSDGSDIRLFDQNKSQLYFWIEEWDYTNKNAVIWVNVPANTAELNIAYNNPQANMSDYNDPYSVFEEFADFVAITTQNLDRMIGIGLYEGTNPVIPTGASGESDEYIREIGNVVYDPNAPSEQRYKLYYTGYSGTYGENERIHVAFSSDGKNWTKYAGNPVITDYRAEDPYVIVVDGVYYLFAEDKEEYHSTGNHAIRRWHSSDGINWTDDGQITGIPDPQSPTVWYEDGTWYMLYECMSDSPEDVRLAMSSDGMNWTDQGQVFTPADSTWAEKVVPNDIIKIDGYYYMIYHGYISAESAWDIGLAKSTDLQNWTDQGRLVKDLDYAATGQWLQLEDGTIMAYYYGCNSPYSQSEADSSGIYFGYPITTDSYDMSIGEGSWDVDVNRSVASPTSSGRNSLLFATIYSGDIVIESRLRLTVSDGDYSVGIEFMFNDADNQASSFIWAYQDTDNFRIFKRVAGTGSVVASATWTRDTDWHKMRLVWDSDGNITSVLDESTQVQGTITDLSSGKVGIWGFRESGSEVDWVLVCKLEDPANFGTPQTLEFI